MRSAFITAVILLTTAVVLWTIRGTSPTPATKNAVIPTYSIPPPSTNGERVVDSVKEYANPKPIKTELDTKETKPWWREPTFSTYEYDPAFAPDPEYRKFVAHHLFLDAFYKCPVRLEEAFQKLISIVEDWGIDPEKEIELMVHANNMAFQYHAALRHCYHASGTISTEAQRQRARRNRDFTINNLKETFAYLFKDYENANFDEIIQLKPSANFPSASMKIEPGTQLISK